MTHFINALFAMKQITVPGFDEDLEDYLHQFAKEENISLNKATIRLLRQAAGLNRKKTVANGDR